MERLQDIVILIAACIIRLPGEKYMPGEEFECGIEYAEDYVRKGSANYRDEDIAAADDSDDSDSDSITSDDDGVGKVPAGDDGPSGDMVTGDLSDDIANLDADELTADQRTDALRALLEGWLEADPEQADQTKWTQAGSPRNLSVDNAMSFDVSNDDVLPVWNAILKAKASA